MKLKVKRFWNVSFTWFGLVGKNKLDIWFLDLGIPRFLLNTYRFLSLLEGEACGFSKNFTVS